MEKLEQTEFHLVNQFVEQVKQRLERMRVLLLELRQDGSDRERLGELRSMFHNIAGTGGIYGFTELSGIARRGEQRCEVLKKERRWVTPEDRAAFEELINQLAECLNDEREAATGGLLQLLQSTAEVQALEVQILEWSDEARESLLSLVRGAGLPVRGFDSEAALLANRTHAPSALIADANIVARGFFQIIKKLRALPGGDQTAIILVGSLNSFTDKVEAIRQGADAYFDHPLDFTVVRERLEELLQRGQPRQEHILVVDDDPAQSAMMRAILQPVGYQVHSCNDPRHFEQELAAARPNLIILDILMPRISGADLLRYIRQHEKYRGIPVLVISGATDPALRLEATLAGSDLVLQKPVAPPILLRAVNNCLDAARRRGTVTPIEVVVD